MPEENVEAIKRGIEAFNRGDWDVALEGMAEDVVWVPYLAAVEGQRSLYGPAAIRQAWEAQREALGGAAYRIAAEGIRDLGGGVVLVPVRLFARGTASGVELETNLVQLWTVRKGLAVRIDTYADEAEALEAAGLSK